MAGACSSRHCCFSPRPELVSPAINRSSSVSSRLFGGNCFVSISVSGATVEGNESSLSTLGGSGSIVSPSCGCGSLESVLNNSLWSWAESHLLCYNSDPSMHSKITNLRLLKGVVDGFSRTSCTSSANSGVRPQRRYVNHIYWLVFFVNPKLSIEKNETL